MTSLDVLEYP